MTTTPPSQQLTALPHSGMAVPHTRYRATITAQYELSCGVAFTGRLLDGDQSIGTFENAGNGGCTSVSIDATHSTAFAEYVSACRQNDEPVDEESVVEALTKENDLTDIIDEAARQGRTLIRGGDLGLDFLFYRGSALVDSAERDALIEMLTNRGAPGTFAWSIWDPQTGTWVPLVTPKDLPEH